MTAPTLYPKQSAAIERLRDALRAGILRLLLVAPCAFGKTVVLAAIVESFLKRSNLPVVVIVNRRELVNQTLNKLRDRGIDAGVIMGTDKRAKPAMVQVASIATLHRRLKKGAPPAGLVIIDECHHACARSYRETLAAYPDAIWLGVTATPIRADGQGLGDIFEHMVVAATTRELLESGDLTPADCFAYDAPALHEIPVTAGDYQQDKLEAAMNTQVLVGSAVKEYLEHTPGKRALVYAVGVEHSKALAAEFSAAGVPSAHLDQNTEEDARDQMIADLRSGKILALCSVGCLVEGLDVPEAEVCITCRPTRSEQLALQIWGRIMRKAPGKTRAVIHSHDGNFFRHGFPDDDREWSLEKSPPRSERDLMCCTNCGFMTTRFRADGTCPQCGSLQIMPDEERAQSDRRRGKEQVDGKRLSRDEIQRVLDAAKERGRELTRAQAVKVARATREEKAREYLRLEKVRAEKGFLKGFTGNQFRAVFQHWPRFRPEELEGLEPAERPFLPLPPRHDPPRRDPSTIRPAVLG